MRATEQGWAPPFRHSHSVCRVRSFFIEDLIEFSQKLEKQELRPFYSRGNKTKRGSHTVRKKGERRAGQEPPGQTQGRPLAQGLTALQSSHPLPGAGALREAPTLKDNKKTATVF